MSGNPIFPLAGVTPDKTVMEFCCTTVAPVLRYLQDRLGEEGARALVCESEMNWDYLQNRQHWISYDYYCSLLNLAVEKTGDELLPYKAGVEFTDPSSFSFITVCVMRALSVRQAYGLVAQWSRFWSKIHDSEIVASGRNSVVFRNTYPKHKQSKHNCLAVKGSLAALPRYWGAALKSVEELECCCKGDEHCTYRYEWEEHGRVGPPRVGLLIGLICGVVILLLSGASVLGFVSAFSVSLVGYLLGLIWNDRTSLAALARDNHVQADSLLDALRRMEDFNRDLQGTVEGRTAELSKANAQLGETLRELHESQEQVVVKERDAAIGVLAAGMAHELNSPINAIRLSMQALLEDTGPEDPARRLSRPRLECGLALLI